MEEDISVGARLRKELKALQALMAAHVTAQLACARNASLLAAPRVVLEDVFKRDARE